MGAPKSPLILVLPGLGGSGPDHWQTRWEARYPRQRRVAQRDWDCPDREQWLPIVVVQAEDDDVDFIAGLVRRIVDRAAFHTMGVVAE